MNNPILESFKRSVSMWTEQLANDQTAPNMTTERLLGSNGSLIYAQREYIAALESILEVFIDTPPAAPVESVAIVWPKGEPVGYISQQHAAMLMLRDLLPLLEAAVAWNKDNGDRYIYLSEQLETEVAKLLEDTEPAPVAEPQSIQWPEYPKRCNCPDGFHGDDGQWLCWECGGGRF
jgi:hypothetical protein